MMTTDMRQHVHSLIDKADDAQLDAVLSILDPTASSPYTKEDIDGFSQRVQAFEESGSKGYSIEESHAKSSKKYGTL